MRSTPLDGRFLFRWRNFLPVPALLYILALEHYTRAPAPEMLGSLRAVGLGLAAMGFAIRGSVVGTIPPGTSCRSTREMASESLNTEGAYSLVRNPLYLGNLLLWLAAGMFGGRIEGVVFALLVFGLAYERIVESEESFLDGRFGSDFREWARRTPAFVPRLRGYRGSPRGFSLSSVARREVHTLYAFAGAIAIIEANRALATPPDATNRAAWGALTFVAGAIVVVGFATRSR